MDRFFKDSRRNGRHHQIRSCLDCPHTGGACGPGLAVLARLNKAMALACDVVPPEFEMTGTVAMTGCIRPCTAAFRATAAECMLFGGVDDAADIPALVAAGPGDRAVIVTETHKGWLL